MRRGWLLIGLLLLAGCASVNRQVEVDRFNRSAAFEKAVKRHTTYASPGSLWVDRSLYSDIRAHQVGDIVTIVVKEYASAKDYGSTESKKSTSLKTVIKSLFGLKDDVGDFVGMKDPTNLMDASASGNFKGSGKLEQSSSLTTKITAVVTDVLPNGNLVIEGKRTILVNGERKIIGIRGVVRPQDIAPDNTVSSEYVADAEIVYEGKGIVSKSQSPGLFTKLLLWLWPLL